MDRNCRARLCPICQWVALRKESVDRNRSAPEQLRTVRVALRKESVDRNNAVQVIIIIVDVALRKESVDRNHRDNGKIKQSNKVALRKESVDRNYPHCPERQ